MVDFRLGLDLTQVASHNNTRLLEVYPLGLDLTQVASSNSNSNSNNSNNSNRSRNNSRNSHMGPDLTRVDLGLQATPLRHLQAWRIQLRRQMMLLLRLQTHCKVLT